MIGAARAIANGADVAGERGMRSETLLTRLSHACGRSTHGPPSERVLVVDDEGAVRTLTARCLRQAGYETVCAADGDEALAIVSRGAPFDVPLTDLMMPAMRGDELARRLRDKNPALKVLYATGFSDALFVDRQVLWEDEAYLDKPWTPKGLLGALALLCSGSLERTTVSLDSAAS